MGTVVRLKTKGPVILFRDRVIHQINSGVRLAARPIARLLHKLGITANQVSTSRLIGSPITFYLLAASNGSIISYCFTVLIWGYTDAVDGVMSKELEKKDETNIGVLIDPMADKVLVGSMYGFHYETFPRIVFVTIICEAILAFLSLGSVAYAGLMDQNARGAIRKIRATNWGKFKLGCEIPAAILMACYAISAKPEIEIAVYVAAITAIFLLIMSLLTKVKKVFA